MDLRSSGNGCWFVILIGLGMGVGAILLMLVYLLITLPIATSSNLAPTPITLSLPTAPVATTTFNPPVPHETPFVAKEPIRGFNNCETYGFRGIVWTADNESFPGIQVVVWDDQERLSAIETTDVSGIYEIEMTTQPTTPQFWLQLYQGDRPVSEAIPLDITANCETGYQIYQVDWQATQP